MAFLGEVRRFAFDFAPRGWAPCDGQFLPVTQNHGLNSLIESTYGGRPDAFALPDLQGRTAVHMGGAAGPIGTKGGGSGPSRPYGTIFTCIALQGTYPFPGDRGMNDTETPYVGEIRLFAGQFAPQGWALCNGQLLSIAENDTLFGLIGTTFGGDGQDVFAVPNLRNAVAIHRGPGHAIGETNTGPIGLEASPVEMLYIISRFGAYPMR